MPNTATGCITGGHGFARTGVGRMAVGPERTSIQPGIGNGINNLFAASAEKLRNHGSGGNPYEKNMVQSNPVKTVFQSQDPLNFMRLNHRDEQIADAVRLLSFG